MKHKSELQKLLFSLNKKSYPAYKSLQGSYSFDDFELTICHVQGDPFASLPIWIFLLLIKPQAFLRSFFHPHIAKLR